MTDELANQVSKLYKEKSEMADNISNLHKDIFINVEFFEKDFMTVNYGYNRLKLTDKQKEEILIFLKSICNRDLRIIEEQIKDLKC